MNKKHFFAAVILLLLLAIGIQPALATIRLTSNGWDDGEGGDPGVGTWDLPTKTGTLITDVYEMIQISSSGTSTDYLVLDGAEHTVSWVSGPRDQGIYIQEKSYVTIKNLIVQNFDNGIQLVGGSYNNFIGNTASGNIAGSGILISKSNDMFCTDNTLTDNNVFGNKYGIQIYQSDDNTLTNNIASGNTFYAIFLHLSSGNTLTGNTASDNTGGIGFYLNTSDNNTLTNNTSSNNTFWNNQGGHGIRLYDCDNNQIYNNNFIANTTQASVSGGTGNLFNLPAPTGGNYWSDYTGIDRGDGIGEPEYTFIGGQDNLPWVVENGWSIPPTPEEKIEELIAYVVSLNLHHGIENSLDAKLQNALDALNAANAGQRQDAVNKMQAFINAVEAQRGKKINDEQADELVAKANVIIDRL